MCSFLFFIFQVENLENNDKNDKTNNSSSFSNVVNRLLLEITNTNNTVLNKDNKEHNMNFINNVESLLRNMAVLNPITFEKNVRLAIDIYLDKFKYNSINRDQEEEAEKTLISLSIKNSNVESLNIQKGEILSMLSGLIDHSDLLMKLESIKK